MNKTPRTLLHAAAMASIAMLGLCSEIAAAADAPVQPVVVRAVARFDFDRASLRPGDRDALLSDVGKMKDVTWQSITATGYTDAVGAAGYNARLSAKRAEAVKAYLVDKGIDGTMIATEAKAAAKPLASNASPIGRAKNRRTEIEFRGVKSTAP